MLSNKEKKYYIDHIKTTTSTKQKPPSIKWKDKMQPAEDICIVHNQQKLLSRIKDSFFKSMSKRRSTQWKKQIWMENSQEGKSEQNLSRSQRNAI